MKLFNSLVAVVALLAGSSHAQVVATTPFVGDGFDGFEAQAVQNSACLPGGMFEGRANLCAATGGLLRVAQGTGAGGTIFARSGAKMTYAQGAGASFTFVPPVQKFGGWIGTLVGQIPSTWDGTATFYDANGTPLGTLPIEANGCELNCSWTWNGFDAGAGPRIARVDMQSNLSSGGGLCFDDMVALFGSTPTGAAYCFGDGAGTICPCGDVSPAPRGCMNSTFRGARLVATGAPTLSNDHVILLGDGAPSFASALYFQGTTRAASGAGVVFGDGLRCAAGAIQRLGVRSSVDGVSQYPGPSDPAISLRGAISGPGTYTYQMWYRDPSASFCTASTFNLSNGFEITWQL